MALKTGVKGLYDLGRLGASKAIKSDFAKKTIREIADKCVSKKLDPLHHGGQIDYSKWCPMSMYSPQGVNDPKDPLYKGGSLDIHKAIGKLPKLKSGFTLPGHKHTGSYNPLDKQLKYDKNIGQILDRCLIRSCD